MVISNEITQSKSIQLLKIEFKHLDKLIAARLNGDVSENIFEHISANGKSDTKEESHFFDKYTFEEKMILLIALAPHVHANYFDKIIQQYYPQGGELPEFGGVKSGNNRGTVATGETVLFLLAGNELEKRVSLQKYFSDEHFFFKKNILWLEEVKSGEPQMSGKLILAQEVIDRILFGKISKPKFSPEFPARHLTTKLQWDDIILHQQTADQIQDIKNWLEHNGSILSDRNLSRKIKPGYRSLFYGPPGTGKTAIATLLGKQFNKEVYRVDLSQIVSKYIGETEKNLEKIFVRAENKNWILFFDEGDALFGKRTVTQSANDKYANQEVSYLLQRVEDFPGLILLATNFKNNIDAAFLRRFNSLIYFPMPDADERFLIWKKSLPDFLNCEDSINLRLFAQKYVMSGASILNAVHYATLKTLAGGRYIISETDLLNGIRNEFAKEEKTL